MHAMPTVKDFINNENVKKLVAITNRINIFSILAKDESETSDTLFMAWLFNLDKEKGNCFARMFLKKIEFYDFDFNYFEVFPEKTISSLSKIFDIVDNFSEIHKKKPDIAIIFYRNGEVPCGLLIIENKINANESENQTGGYAQFMNSLKSVPYKKGIFLTRKGDTASSKDFKHFQRNDVLKKTVESYLQDQIVSHGTNPAIIDLIRQYYEKLDIEDRQDEIEKEIINEFKSLILIINDDEKMKKEIPDNYWLTYYDLYKQCKAYSKTVYKDYDEFISKSNFSKNDKAVELRKEINNILVNDQEYKLIPNYSPTGFSYSFNKGIKMINTTNQKFAWLVVDASGLKIEFAKNIRTEWGDFENQLKDEFAGIRLVQPKNSYGEIFGVRISSKNEFDKIVRPLIKFIKGYLLKPN